jgi:DNA-binding NarL/FixJ family response regulator
LTARERQLVRYASEGMQNKEIAWAVHLQEGTIKSYMSKIFLKVGVRNRTALVGWALRQTVRSEPAEELDPPPTKAAED